MGIVRHIPNTITSMNLIFGSLGVICSFNGNLEAAFCFMIAAAICDFCDGLSARLLNAYSALGKELDSLADMVSFGVLPAIMLYNLMARTHEATLLNYIPLVLVVFSALRLAKFNIDDRQTDNFIGLPTPACAMLCGSFAYYVSCDPESVLHTWAASRFFIPSGSLFLSALLVCEIPMFSMKLKKKMKPGTPIHKQRVSFIGTIFVATILTILLGLNWSMIVILAFTAYIVMNIGIYILFPRLRK
ncbi:MAG: CDP-diacylglycerol--serine O-phosphatidyltransferase [Bacteroidales bacterium]|nr:CDP-diacylglycerol--serine O-phosphatidyltransferase [Bacteroidales bacterium]